jgi:hypothetical protein
MLSSSEKERLIDKLISSLDKSDKVIDLLWEKEAKGRINAYSLRKINAVIPLHKVATHPG